MTDEHKLLSAVDRAARAEALINDDTLAEAFAKLEAEYLRAWRMTGVTDKDTMARERLWQAINLLSKVQDNLRTMIADGKLAKSELAMIEGKQRRNTAA